MEDKTPLESKDEIKPRKEHKSFSICSLPWEIIRCYTDTKPPPINFEALPRRLVVFGEEFMAPCRELFSLNMHHEFYEWVGTDITDQDGKNWFKIDSNERVNDANGKLIFGMRPYKGNGCIQEIYSETNPKKVLFEVTSNIYNTQQRAEIIDIDGRLRVVTLVYRGLSAEMYLGDLTVKRQLIARGITKSSANFGMLNADSNSFRMEILPGVDMALVVAIVAASNEMERFKLGNGKNRICP